ncbi:TOG array regulator of axonemal microtubules protein 2-like [Siniperca chuatsi]|uniref:TOG array regulator of axonemal microtubules protein 2-like n=1 Tax=Siniperca chuatsi TaxID=119488 RepID=UPI001CE22AFD|nr:TOG array regulator of axonemal microtubules protein 2-like [Siniperca chuatsi]
MANRKISNTFLQWWKGKKSFKDDSDPPGSHSSESGSSSQSRILDIEGAERAERAALIQRAERLCTSQKAHSNAVLERLGFSVQHDTLPSPQPPASPRRSPESSLRVGRIRPILDLPPLNVEVTGASKVAKLTPQNRSPSPDASISSVDTLSSVDTHTPNELRAISQMDNFTPTPPPKASTRRVSRLPVMSGKLVGAGKAVADGCKLQSAKTKVEEFMERLEQFQLVHFPSPQPPAAPRRTPAAPRTNPAAPTRNPASPRRTPAAPTRNPASPRRTPSPRRTQAVPTRTPALPRRTPAAPMRNPASPRRTPAVTPAVTPMIPTPPSTAAPTKRREPRRGTNLRPPKADNRAARDDLQPLVNPSESLSLCFKQLTTDDWEKKMDGLKSVRALARHHPELLQTKLHEVCLVLTEEVANLRSVVACAAMDTIAELHLNLGRAMDPEAERTGRALLLKLAQTTNAFIHQQANLALDALVEGCSTGRVMSALLNTGLSHRCAAVRGSTAQHLHQLGDIVGEDRILTAGKIFAERFLTAVSKMSVDAAPEVRHHGQKMLQGLAYQREFMVLWSKLIPVKDRRPLEKILKKNRQ